MLAVDFESESLPYWIGVMMMMMMVKGFSHEDVDGARMEEICLAGSSASDTFSPPGRNEVETLNSTTNFGDRV